MIVKSARAFAAGLRHAAHGHAARWRECWCCLRQKDKSMLDLTCLGNLRRFSFANK